MIRKKTSGRNQLLDAPWKHRRFSYRNSRAVGDLPSRSKLPEAAPGTGSRESNPSSFITSVNRHPATALGQHNHITMLTTLISLLIAGLVLYVIYYIVGMFIKGRPLNIIGIILGLVFLLYALRAFNVASI